MRESAGALCYSERQSTGKTEEESEEDPCADRGRVGGGTTEPEKALLADGEGSAGGTQEAREVSPLVRDRTGQQDKLRYSPARGYIYRAEGEP